MLPIYFAPLQGYTEDAYRRIHNQFAGGVEAYFSPFVRLEHGDLRAKDSRDIRPAFNEGIKLIPQIITGSAEETRQLADILHDKHGYTDIDINLGCPFTLQTRHGKGCGLMTRPDCVKEIAAYIQKRPDIRFSVKMRLGLNDNEDWRTILPILNDTPLQHVTLHPRNGSQRYDGELYMDCFSEFHDKCAHPVIYNGGLRTVEDIQSIERQYPKLKGIMIGRGLLARPTLAAEYTENKTTDRQSLMRIIMGMHDSLIEHYSNVIPSEEQRLAKVKTYWDFLDETIGKKAFKKIKKSGNMKNYLRAINEIRLL